MAGKMRLYGAVATKIRGMRSKLLKKEDFQRLAYCRDINEIYAALSSYSAYEKALSNLSNDDFRFRDFERILTGSLLTDMRKIACFLTRPQLRFLKVYFSGRELRFINDVLRAIFSGADKSLDYEIYRHLYGESEKLNFEKIIEAKTIDELISALEGNGCAAALKKVRNSFQNPTLFDYECALTRFQFTYFWEEVNRLNSKYDKEILLKAHGAEIDLLNLIWIARCKMSYEVSNNEIYGLLIPAYPGIKYADVRRLVEAENITDFMHLAKQSRYGKYIDEASPLSLQKAYEELISHIHDTNRRKFPYSFSVIESYVHDKEQEIYLLIRIAESVRYERSPELILKTLGVK